MTQTPRFEVKSVDGLRTLAVLGFGWDPALAAVVEQESIEFLSVTGVESDIGFVRKLGGIRRLVLAVQRPRDLRALEGLESVEQLWLALGPGKTPPVALDRLPNLVDLSVDWVAGLERIAWCSALRRLSIGRPPEPDLSWLTQLAGLSELMLTDGRKLEGLAGIEAFDQLRKLTLTSLKGLETLKGVDELGSLTLLDVTTCRAISEIGPVASLGGLHSLAIDNCGDVDSLQPLSALEALESFFAIESTNVQDGDLSPLMGLPRLRRFGMRSRRHYKPSVDDVHQRIADR